MSSNPRGQPKLTGLLVLICLGLLTVIYLELDDPPLSRTAQSMPAGSGTPARAEPQADMAFELPPLAAYSEIAARPLFSPSRRPAPRQQAAAQPAEPRAVPADEFLLRGVALAGDSRVALIERRTTVGILRVLEGQSVGGWRLAAIRPDAIVLESEGEEHVLEVEKDKSPSVTAQPLLRRVELTDPRRSGRPAEADALDGEVRSLQEQIDFLEAQADAIRSEAGLDEQDPDSYGGEAEYYEEEEFYEEDPEYYDEDFEDPTH